MYMDYFTALKKHFYIHVPISLGTTAINESVDAFFKFLNEPEVIKSRIDFSIAPNHRRGEVGYRKRIESDHIYNDNKEFFHYHPAILERYPYFVEENATVCEFLNKANGIWKATFHSTKQILSNFNAFYPGAYDKIFKTDHIHIILRFLKYDWKNSGKYLAKPHYDAGSFSLAIAESCPGLRIGSGPENLEIVEHRPGEAIFMLSSNFKKVLTDAEHLSAGWHDVIQLDEQQLGKPFARWAVVAFIEAHGVEALPRTETHKWFSDTEIS